MLCTQGYRNRVSQLTCRPPHPPPLWCALSCVWGGSCGSACVTLVQWVFAKWVIECWHRCTSAIGTARGRMVGHYGMVAIGRVFWYSWKSLLLRGIDERRLRLHGLRKLLLAFHHPLIESRRTNTSVFVSVRPVVVTGLGRPQLLPLRLSLQPAVPLPELLTPDAVQKIHAVPHRRHLEHPVEFGSDSSQP